MEGKQGFMKTEQEIRKLLERFKEEKEAVSKDENLTIEQKNKEFNRYLDRIHLLRKILEE